MVSTSVLSDRSAVWLSAVPPVNQPDAQAVWSTIKTRLTALADALYSARSAAEHAARLVRDVLADETDETKWRCVKQRRSDGSCDARSSATYDADDLLVLGYSAAVVHRYHGGNRRTFEVWARCTEEGSNVAPRQRPDTVSKCLWHQLHVPLVDVEGDDEPDIALIEVRLTRCLVLRQRDAERFAGAARVP